MINLTDPKQVKCLQANMRMAFDSADGKEVIKFFEWYSGWFDFSEDDPNKILIAHGRRQVLAAIKTLLELTPEQVAYIAKQKEL